MNFLLQSDNVALVEKRVVRAATYSTSFPSANIINAFLNNIPIDLPRDAIPVGTVEFVRQVMSKHNIVSPSMPSYPDCLFQFLHRKVWSGQYQDCKDNTQFVKPCETKAFTGSIIQNLEEDVGPTCDCWFSEPVEFITEVRYYIVNGKLVGYGRYDDGDDNNPMPNTQTILAAIEIMNQNNAPSGYSLDFGVLTTCETALIEANDGWALGYYKGTCSYVDYALLLAKRWADIIQ